MIVLNLVTMEQGMDRREQKRKRGKRRRSPYVRANLMMEKSNTKIKRLDDCSEPGDDGAGKEMLRKHLIFSINPLQSLTEVSLVIVMLL